MYYDDEPVYIEEGYYDFDDLADYVLTNIDEEVLLEISNALANKVTLARRNRFLNSPDPNFKLADAVCRNTELRVARQNRLSKGFFNKIKNYSKARSDKQWLRDQNSKFDKAMARRFNSRR